MTWMRRRQHLRAALGVRRPRVSRIRPGTPPGPPVAAESGQSPVIQVRGLGPAGVGEEPAPTIDGVVDAYFPVIETLAERMHELEEEALTPRASQATLLRLIRPRHDLVAVRRAVWPPREEVLVLQREESHSSRWRHASPCATSSITPCRSARSSVIEVVLTIFIPLTFIASIHGMNFKHMAELEARWGYPAVLAVMLPTAGDLVAYFRRRGRW